MIRPLLKLVRFPLVLTAAADSATGYLLFRPAAADVSAGTLALLAGSSVCLYSAGMALNDVADAKRDAALHPERPLPSGRLRPGLAAAAGIVLLAWGFTLAVPVGRAAATLAGGVAAGILLYDFVLKSRAVPGALCMGLLRGLNLMMGVAAAAADPAAGWFAFPGLQAAHLGPAVWLLLYVFFLTMISVQEERRAWARPFLVFLSLQVAVVLSSPVLNFPPHPAGSCAVIGLAAVLLYFGQGVRVQSGGRRVTLFGTSVRTGGAAVAIAAHVRLSVLLVIALDASFLLCARRVEQGAAVLALLLPSALMIRLYRHV